MDAVLVQCISISGHGCVNDPSTLVKGVNDPFAQHSIFMYTYMYIHAVVYVQQGRAQARKSTGGATSTFQNGPHVASFMLERELHVLDFKSRFEITTGQGNRGSESAASSASAYVMQVADGLCVQSPTQAALP